MAEYVAIVQARHRDLRNDHLKERGEGRKDTELVRIKTKACRSGKVSTFHDSGRNKHFGVSLMNHLQTGRTLQIACAVRVSVPGRFVTKNIRTINDHDLPGGLVSRQTIKHTAHCFAKYNAICIEITC